MTKQDFELVAATLRSIDFESLYHAMHEAEGTETKAGRLELATIFAEAISPTHPRFDRARFISAVTAS